MNKLGRSLAVFNWASQKAEKDLVHTVTKEKLKDHYEILDEVGRGICACSSIEPNQFNPANLINVII